MVEARAAELQTGRNMLHTEGHVRRLRSHVQLFEQAREIRICDFIENHESGINRHGNAIFVNVDGVGVTANVIVLLEEREFVARMQKMRAAESGDSRADDGDFGHGKISVVGRVFLVRRVRLVGANRHGPQFPNQAGPRKRFQQIIRDVNFPPVKTLARRGHVAMMIVVPAFAKRDERENQTVAAVVIRFVAALADEMRDGIYGRRCVKQNRGADEKAPD
jgi:hypothetical protein